MSSVAPTCRCSSPWAISAKAWLQGVAVMVVVVAGVRKSIAEFVVVVVVVVVVVIVIVGSSLAAIVPSPRLSTHLGGRVDVLLLEPLDRRARALVLHHLNARRGRGRAQEVAQLLVVDLQVRHLSVHTCERERAC